jgi:hypothetical protein
LNLPLLRARALIYTPSMQSANCSYSDQALTSIVVTSCFIPPVGTNTRATLDRAEVPADRKYRGPAGPNQRRGYGFTPATGLAHQPAARFTSRGRRAAAHQAAPGAASAMCFFGGTAAFSYHAISPWPRASWKPFSLGGSSADANTG